MKERGFIAYPHEVVPILGGRQTQFTRVVKPQLKGEPIETLDGAIWPPLHGVLCPYGIPGDHLWLKEKWAAQSTVNERPPREIERYCREAGYDNGPFSDLWYQADELYRQWGNQPVPRGKWRSSTHMPRWASRITLRVKDVRVERVQDISEEDCIKEGVIKEFIPSDPDNFHPPGSYGFVSGLYEFPEGMLWVTPQEAFQELWDSIHAKKPGCSWADNPWTWCVKFEKVDAK